MDLVNNLLLDKATDWNPIYSGVARDVVIEYACSIVELFLIREHKQIFSLKPLGDLCLSLTVRRVGGIFRAWLSKFKLESQDLRPF